MIIIQLMEYQCGRDIFDVMEGVVCVRISVGGQVRELRY